MIICIGRRMNGDGNTHKDILALKWKDMVTGEVGYSTMKDLVVFLKTNPVSIAVNDHAGNRVPLAIRYDKLSPYLQAIRDGIYIGEMLNLPEY